MDMREQDNKAAHKSAETDDSDIIDEVGKDDEALLEAVDEFDENAIVEEEDDDAETDLFQPGEIPDGSLTLLACI
jgi:hypothetical protein